MSTSALAPGLARKVKKILDIKTESTDLVSSLATLSSFYDDNTPAARRALRSTIEQRGLSINQQFLTAAETVIHALDDVQSQLDALNAACSSMGASLSATRASTGGLLAESDKLERARLHVEGRRQMVADFLEQYQLTPEEVAALQGEQVGPAFFATLHRVRTIHDNCRSLLRGHHQRAGLELMDQMASYQEGAYERLCRWVQAECRTIGEFDAPEVDPQLTAAVGALRQRPVLFKYCAEEVAAARHGALFQRFIIALTRGGPGGLPRPIEMHAHDPKRYINDMLAWVHQALASEHEFVVALFGDEQQRELNGDAADNGRSPFAPGSAQQPVAESAPPSTDLLDTAALLDRIFDSICRPLRVRVEQVLMMSPPPLLCYQLAQLHDFYAALVVRLLGPGAQLSVTLGGCRDMARRAFLEQLRSAGERLLRAPPPPPQDLSPPPQVSAALHALQDIMNAHEGALHLEDQQANGAGNSGDSADSDSFAPVLAVVLDPLIEMCRRSAEALSPNSPARLDDGSKLDPTAYHSYLINCLAAMQAVTSLRSFCAARTAALGSAIAGHVEALVGGEVGRLLSRCGLAEIADRIRLYQSQGSNKEPGSLASDPALSLYAVREALRAFFVLVSSPDALPDFGKLQQPRLRTDAVASVSRSLVDAYELVWCTLEDPLAGYLEQGGASSIKHNPSQVRTILGVL